MMTCQPTPDLIAAYVEGTLCTYCQWQLAHGFRPAFWPLHLNVIAFVVRFDV